MTRNACAVDPKLEIPALMNSNVVSGKRCRKCSLTMSCQPRPSVIDPPRYTTRPFFRLFKRPPRVLNKVLPFAVPPHPAVGIRQRGKRRVPLDEVGRLLNLDQRKMMPP